MQSAMFPNQPIRQVPDRQVQCSKLLFPFSLLFFSPVEALFCGIHRGQTVSWVPHTQHSACISSIPACPLVECSPTCLKFLSCWSCHLRPPLSTSGLDQLGTLLPSCQGGSDPPRAHVTSANLQKAPESHVPGHGRHGIVSCPLGIPGPFLRQIPPPGMLLVLRSTGLYSQPLSPDSVLVDNPVLLTNHIIVVDLVPSAKMLTCWKSRTMSCLAVVSCTEPVCG